MRDGAMPVVLCVATLLVAQPLVAGQDAASGAETRVVEYLKRHVEPGQPVVVSELYNRVFTTPEERAALDRLFNTFFKLPLAIAQHQQATGRPPTLLEISEQFRFEVPGQADLMLRIMEADPRMPRFLERDPASGEIRRVDVPAILAHPRFGRSVERTIAGWEGRPAPPFEAEGFDGTRVTAASFQGKPHLVYFWFSGCPPCVRSAPVLEGLLARHQRSGFELLAMNADRVLEVPASERERAAHARAMGEGATFAHATTEVLEAYGGVSVFPTFFFVDARGTVVQQLVHYQEVSVLESAVRRALEPRAAAPPVSAAPSR